MELERFEKNYNKGVKKKLAAVESAEDAYDIDGDDEEAVITPEASAVEGAGMPSITLTPPDLCEMETVDGDASEEAEV